MLPNKTLFANRSVDGAVWSAGPTALYNATYSAVGGVVYWAVRDAVGWAVDEPMYWAVEEANREDPHHPAFGGFLREARVT